MKEKFNEFRDSITEKFDKVKVEVSGLADQAQAKTK
jgi:hypothetical protein